MLLSKTRPRQERRFPARWDVNDLVAAIAGPKKICAQGRLDSGRDEVQPNWGRIIQVGLEHYNFIVGPSAFQGFVDAQGWYLTASAVKFVGGMAHQTESITVESEDLVEFFQQELGRIADFAGDSSVRGVAASLAEAPDAYAKLKVFRSWFDGLEGSFPQRDAQSRGAISNATILERLEGFVDRIEGATAFVTLESEFGDTLHGEYPARELAEKGINERRRFLCKTIEENGRVRVEFEAIPDEPVSTDEEDAINRRIDELLADDELDGDY